MMLTCGLHQHQMSGNFALTVSQNETIRDVNKFIKILYYSTRFSAQYCDIPPNGQEGMQIFANSTGNRFGTVCLGSKFSPNLVAGRELLLTECGTIHVEYVDSEMSPGSALYREIELHSDISFNFFKMFE